MTFFRSFVLSIALIFTGCAGIDYAKETYEGAFRVDFKAADGTVYRIFDQPEKSRLMIGFSSSQSAQQGFIRGLGPGFGTTSPVLLRDAAEEYLKSTGRRCESRDITLIVDSQYEVRYRCVSGIRTYRRAM